MLTAYLLGLAVAQNTEKPQIFLPDKTLLSVGSAYVDQGESFEALAAKPVDLIVVDETRVNDANKLKKGPNGRRAVIVSISPWQISPKSPFWKASWDADRDGKLDSTAPSWLKPSKTPGYFDADFNSTGWHQYLYAAKDSIVSKVIAAGADGIAYQVLQRGESKIPEWTDEQQNNIGMMIIKATYEGKGRKQGFVTFLRNPGRLLDFRSLRFGFDGAVVDGLYFGADEFGKPTDKQVTAEYERDIVRYVKFKRLVINVAYTNDKDQIAEHEKRSRAKGFYSQVVQQPGAR